MASVLDNDSGCHRHQRPRFSIIDYEDVLKRPRLAIDPGKAADAMTRIREVVSVVSSAASVAAAIDPDDNRFLECAQAAQAHYLVTGNTRHFPGAWKETRLVTPREFIDAWESAPDESR